MHSGVADLDVIKHDMGFLFDEYGFTVIREVMYNSFGNWQFILELAQCGRLQFAEDRGQVSVSFGPRDWPPRGAESGPWHDFADVIDYISFGKERVDLDAIWLDGAAMASSDDQLRRLAVVLKRLMPSIRDVFGSAKYLESRASLDRSLRD